MMETGEVSMGIDYSTFKIDVVGVRDDRLIFAKEHLFRKRSHKFSNHHLSAVASFIMGFICEAQERGMSLRMCMEDPFIHHKHKSSVIPMAMTAGAIAAGVSLYVGDEHADEMLMRVPPPEWKKAVIGKGNAKKEEIRSWVFENTNEHVRKKLSNQDLVDAYCLSLYRKGIKNA